MTPGSQFATMLVPNSAFASLAHNPATTDTNKRPLFSPVSSNPVYGMYIGQMILAHIESSEQTEDTLSMTVTLNIPATLLVYDSTGKAIGKAGGTIAGADFELKADGTQTVTLPNPDGNYRVAIQSAATAQGLLTVKTYQGGAEISSEQIRLDIAPHQILTTTIAASDTEPPIVAPVNAAPSYDFNGDGVTDNTDVSMLVRHWNSCRGQQKYDAFFDVNDDGCITVNPSIPIQISKQPVRFNPCRLFI